MDVHLGTGILFLLIASSFVVGRSTNEDSGTECQDTMRTSTCEKQSAMGKCDRYPFKDKCRKTCGHCNDNVLTSNSTCPSSHPFPYNKGQHCCAEEYEKVEAKYGIKCDGSVILFDSRCCKGDDYEECLSWKDEPKMPCTNYGCSGRCMTCKSGRSSDGGTSVEARGYCEQWCSAKGYCGNGPVYKLGTDCRSCPTENLRYVDDGCHSQGLDVVGKYQAESLKAFLRCCSDDGSSCDTLSDCQASSTLVNYADAVKECTAHGMRLCTKDEILSDICCQTGGKCDSYGVWTSTLYTGNTTTALPTTTSSEPPIQVGYSFGCYNDEIALKSHQGKYVTAEKNGKATANRRERRSWEKFIAKRVDRNVFTFESAKHYTFLTAGNELEDFEIKANRYKASNWERFEVVPQPEGKIALKTFHGKYVVAEQDGSLRADRKEIARWETFTPECTSTD